MGWVWNTDSCIKPVKHAQKYKMQIFFAKWTRCMKAMVFSRHKCHLVKLRMCYHPKMASIGGKGCDWFTSGAIIGDGDRKRAPFLVLGLAPWYGTIFLFFEQIAPSPAAHARTYCEGFCGYRAREMASEIHEIFYAFLRFFFHYQQAIKSLKKTCCSKNIYCCVLTIN